ncbi:unnamed protein product [marine sediment metagenome]|uniref:Uncharacterized protein n=1 Tax=marine sediment metagenome TaxID=412755 RepID=X1F9K1_9ZZZZ
MRQMPDGRGKEFEAMDDETLINAMTPPISSAIHACYYRSLGQASVPWNIKSVERFIQLNTEGKGKFFGEIAPLIMNDKFHLFLWKNCDVSEGHGITYNVYVWGLTNGVNVVFSRRYFWKMYFIRGAVEESLGLKPMTLRPREYIF